MQNNSHTDLLMQNHTNFTKSRVPIRIMFYENGNWNNFDENIQNLVKVAFSEKKAVLEAENSLFDFKRMLQIEGPNQRSIAWIDDEKKCFFPKRFINSKYSKRMDIENALKSENSEKEVVSNRWGKTRVLGETEKVYETVEKLFMESIRVYDKGARVTGISKAVTSNSMDIAKIDVFRTHLEALKNLRGKPNMSFGWFGTNESGVETVLRHGFSGPSEIEECGVGVYLSPIKSAHTSAMLSEVDGNGEKHVILCRVLLGNREKVEAGSHQIYPSSTDFDTGADDLENPKWYVIWCANMNTYIIPECVVSYHPSIGLPGQFSGTPVVKSLPNPSVLSAKLFTKLGTLLPSSRVQEFQKLCSTYKDGKLAKDCFLKKLRSVVGDEILVSAIREVRG